MTRIMTSAIEGAIDRLISAYEAAPKDQIHGSVSTAVVNLKEAMAKKAGRPRVVTQEDIDNCIKLGITSGTAMAKHLECSQPTISRFLKLNDNSG